VLDFSALLRFVVAQGASDLHIKAGSPPRVRVDGELRMTPFPEVSPEDVDALLVEVIPPGRADEYATTGDADFTISRSGVGRFRANAFRQRGTSGLVLRHILPVPTSVTDLGLPAVVTRLADEVRGMVLVTGPTGSGKSTTLAAMTDHINRTRAVNIVTIEDPIEMIHSDLKGIVSQREVGIDTQNFSQGLRRAMRQDPDVILIGEIRDMETVKAALTAAGTGHLVLSTLHTTNAEETINRIVDFFPPHEQRQTRLTLSSVLKGVISQRLIAGAVGKGRVAAIEAMVTTGRIADRIVDPDSGQGESITELIAKGQYHGMQTFDQSLFTLYQLGTITLRAAMSNATSPHDLRVALQGAGLLATA
jgi:twitching motility protein PilT